MRQNILIVLASATIVLSPRVVSAQFVQQGPKLVGSGAVWPAFQGTGVALSADGSTAIVGAMEDDGARGASWIFTRSGGTWTQQGPKLVGTGGVGISFQGEAVALSADGNTAVVGGSADNNSIGAIWIFVRSGTTWAQQGPKLVGTGGIGTNYQGQSVAISADGNTVLVGGSQDNSQVGAAWVFTRSGSVWTQQGSKLVGTGAAWTALQGWSVALSADGNVALVGGPNDAPAGSAWVFTRSGSTWTQMGSKIAGTGAVGYAWQGSSVALSSDAMTAAVGGYSDDSGAGAVWIFTRSGTTWTQQGTKLVGTGAEGFAFQGAKLSLSGDGNLLIESGWSDNYNSTAGTSTGAAWVFKRTAGSSWLQFGAKLRGADGSANAMYGTAVAMSADGRTAIVGGQQDTNAAYGAAWIFTPATDLRRAGDHDGDGKIDMTLYHIPSGQWSSLTSSTNFTGATNRFWGGPAFAAAPGDYDGDGKTDLGLYDPSTGDWYVLLSSANFTTSLSKNVGGPGWTMVPRDFDGDGKTDFAVYNSTTGQWYGLNSSTNYTTTFSVFWGGSNYLQVPADYDGDGRADFGVYNLDTGMWSILLSSTNYTTSLSKPCGGSGWTPVPADYDGDGKADLVVYNYNPGTWYGLKSSGNYLTTISVSWGGSNYQPVKGDYDGDGKADFAVYVSNTGMWYILLSGANYTTSIVRNWGGAGWAAIPQFP